MVPPRQVWGKRHFSGLWLLKGTLPAMSQPWRWLLVELPIVSRRHLDRYSLLFRSFFACSSFGSRSVFDRLTNNERETNERRTRTEREVNGNRTSSDRESVIFLSGPDDVLNYLFCKHKRLFSCYLFLFVFGFKGFFLVLEIILGLKHKDTTWHPRNARVLAVLIQYLILFNFITDVLTPCSHSFFYNSLLTI